MKFWIESPRKSDVSFTALGPISVPKSDEFQVINDLLHQAEHWKNLGEKDIESATWKLIAERALKYSEKEKNAPSK